MAIKPYSTDEQKPLKASEAGAAYRVAGHTYARPTTAFPTREEAMPEGCISSEEFWSVFDSKLRAAYAEVQGGI